MVKHSKQLALANYMFVSVLIKTDLQLLKLVSTIFCQIFIFSPNDKKLFSLSRYSNFCIFSLPFHTFQNQKNKWKWNNYDVMNWLA